MDGFVIGEFVGNGGDVFVGVDFEELRFFLFIVVYVNGVDLCVRRERVCEFYILVILDL